MEEPQNLCKKKEEKKLKEIHFDRAAETLSTGTGNELTNKEEQRVQIVEKPKRKVTRPAYLDDYA